MRQQSISRSSLPVGRCPNISRAKLRRIVLGRVAVLVVEARCASSVKVSPRSSSMSARASRSFVVCGRSSAAVAARRWSKRHRLPVLFRDPMPGPGLLARVLVAKNCDHTPLNRQTEIYAREGVDLDRPTLAGWVGAPAALLDPLVEVVRHHLFAGTRIHSDDTPVPVLAPGHGRTRTGRLWTYVRDGRPCADLVPPAAWFAFSPDRRGEHPQTISRASTELFRPVPMLVFILSMKAAGSSKQPAGPIPGGSYRRHPCRYRFAHRSRSRSPHRRTLCHQKAGARLAAGSPARS
jgi:hypothetical protein